MFQQCFRVTGSLTVCRFGWFIALRPRSLQSLVSPPCLGQENGSAFDLKLKSAMSCALTIFGENHLSASAPTLALSGFPCSRSVVFASSATLLLLTQYLVCCIHRLNPHRRADVQPVHPCRDTRQSATVGTRPQCQFLRPGLNLGLVDDCQHSPECASMERAMGSSS